MPSVVSIAVNIVYLYSRRFTRLSTKYLRSDRKEGRASFWHSCYCEREIVLIEEKSKTEIDIQRDLFSSEMESRAWRYFCFIIEWVSEANGRIIEPSYLFEVWNKVIDSIKVPTVRWESKYSFSGQVSEKKSGGVVAVDPNAFKALQVQRRTRPGEVGIT